MQIDLLSADIIDESEANKNADASINDNNNTNNREIDRLQKKVAESQAYLNDLKEQFDAVKRRKGTIITIITTITINTVIIIIIIIIKANEKKQQNYDRK